MPRLLILCLGDKELRGKKAENARKRVKENFTIPKMVVRMEEWYSEVEYFKKMIYET